jgi:hypothetical protein
MSDDAMLHDNARELLRSGRLPGYRPHRLWGGPGSGRDRCLVCGEPVRADQIVLEAEFDSADRARTFFFHVTCFAVLESEGRRVQRPAADHRKAVAEK